MAHRSPNRRPKKKKHTGIKVLGALLLVAIVICVPVVLMRNIPQWVSDITQSSPNADPAARVTDAPASTAAPAPAQATPSPTPTLLGLNKQPIYPGTKVVYLTFDAGPSVYTDRLLDALKDAGVYATFFVTRESAQKHPDALRRMIAEGHAVGNMTAERDDTGLYVDNDSMMSSVGACQTEIEAILGGQLPYRLLRLPGGSNTKIAKSYRELLTQAGYTLFDWNVDGSDGQEKQRRANEIASKVKVRAKDKKEVILRLHDMDTTITTIDALPSILSNLKKKDYAFGTLDQRCAEDGSPRSYLAK